MSVRLNLAARNADGRAGEGPKGVTRADLHTGLGRL